MLVIFVLTMFLTFFRLRLNLEVSTSSVTSQSSKRRYISDFHQFIECYHDTNVTFTNYNLFDSNVTFTGVYVDNTGATLST